MAQPHGADHGVVAALVEEELAAVAQADIRLPPLVDVGRVAKAARRAV